MKPLFKSGSLDEEHFVYVCKRCNLPRFLNCTTFRASDVQRKGTVAFEQFARFWKALTKESTDDVSRVFCILKKPGATVLSPSDFESVILGMTFEFFRFSFDYGLLFRLLSFLFFTFQRFSSTMKVSNFCPSALSFRTNMVTWN